MNPPDVRQSATVAMVTFCILMFTCYFRNMEQGEEFILPVSVTKLSDGRNHTAIQRELLLAKQRVNIPNEMNDYNSHRRHFPQVENIPIYHTSREKSKSVSEDINGAPFTEKDGLLPKGNITQNIRESTCVKQIQFWGNMKLKFPSGEYDCPALDCKTRFIQSSSYERLSNSHAVILHHKGSWKWEELARYRPEGQMWIYMTKESPPHSRKAISPDPERLAFNWTMTYRRDSDFVIPYGKYTDDVSEVPADDNRNWATGKTRLIAWMASNCHVSTWGRTGFVKNLQKLIQVDTYGACGTLKCRRDETCDKILSSYKFYLALENSECTDYITEKFWRNAFSHHLVPIVYGTTREDYEKVAPPFSFIHVSDFGNMTSLVDYIKYLDMNDTAYNEYFDWRKKGTVSWYTATMAMSPKMLCDITKSLVDTDTLRTRGNGNISKIMNMKIWFKRACHHLKDIWNKGANF